MMHSPQRKFVPFEVPESDGEAGARAEKKPYTTPRLTRLGQLDEGDARRIAFDHSGR